MNISFLILVGFSFTTLCASICPMNVGGMDSMMPMSHGDMQMEHEDMAQNEQKQMPCKKCDKNTENIIATLTQTASVKVLVQPLHAFVSPINHYQISLSDAVPRLIHAYTRPPPLAQTLVGTVILRT